MRRLLSVILICMLFASLAAAEDQAPIDWPTFQGNNARTGASDYPAIAKPTIAWSTRVGIMGYLNGPVIDGDRVFVTSSGDRHNVPDERDGVYCLDMKTGDLLWHRKTPLDACGITIDQERVYAGDDSGRFYALSRKTGEPVWATRFEASVFAQPLRVGRLVVVGDAEGHVLAFDAATGDIAWTYDGPGAIRGGLSSLDNKIYAVFLHGRVVCFDLEGEVVWQHEVFRPQRGGAVSEQAYPAPTLTEDGVFIAFARDSYYGVPALASFTLDGKPRWNNSGKDPRRADRRGFGNIRSSPAVYQDWLIYGEPYGNEMVWVDRSNGAFVNAAETGVYMFPQWPSPVIAGDWVYMARHDGGLYAVDMSRDARQGWMAYLGDHAQAGIDAAPKQLRGGGWQPEVGLPIYATPAIARDGTLVVGTGEGWLYCVREAR